MMWLITRINDDYILTAVYAVMIIISFIIKREKKEVMVFFFGFFVMIIAEFIFVSTGVETFIRNSLLGIMPLWFPFLWGYCFVAMKRGIKILEL